MKALPPVTDETANVILDSLRMLRNEVADMRQEMRLGQRSLEAQLGLLRSDIRSMASIRSSPMAGGCR